MYLSLSIPGQQVGVILSLRFPNGIEFIFVHIAGGPSRADALLGRFEARQILTKSSGTRFSHDVTQFSDALLDGAFVVALLLRRLLPVTEKSPALGKVVKSPPDVERIQRFVESGSAEDVRHGVVGLRKNTRRRLGLEPLGREDVPVKAVEVILKLFRFQRRAMAAGSCDSFDGGRKQP